MPISFGGINTGLPPNIVDQMIEAEKIPIKTMKVQKEKSEARMKLVTELETKIGDIKKGLSELANTRGFSDVKLTSGDPNVLSGTVDINKYAPGNWNVEVNELPQKAAVVTNGFPDKDKTKVGAGYLRFNTPDGDKEVYVKSGSNTLEGVAAAINKANIGVKASVINDRKTPDAPYKLIMSSQNSGTDGEVEYPRIYMLDGDQDLYFESTKPAKNGVIKIDGVEFEIGDTKLTDAIPGVTLDLKQANPGHSINVSVKEDREVVSGKIKTFVDGMNGVFSFIQTQNKIDKGSDTSRTLGGDGMIRSVEQSLRQLIQSPQYGGKGNIHTLSELGITFNRNGTLELDQKKFDSVLNARPEEVQAFFVGDGFATGFVPRVRREIGNLLNPSFGTIANRSKGLKNKIDQIDDRIANKERQIEKREQMLRDKFSRLEESMSKLKSQGGQLASMGAGGGNPINSLVQSATGT